MVTWEYNVLNLGKRAAEEDETELNTWGTDGWELVAVLHSGNTFAYLKRPIEMVDLDDLPKENGDRLPP